MPAQKSELSLSLLDKILIWQVVPFLITLSVSMAMLPLRGRRPELLGRGTSALARRSLARLCSVSHAPSTHGAVAIQASLLHRPSCAPPAFGSGPSFSLLLHPDRSPASPVEDATTSLNIIMPGGLGGLTLEMPAGAEVTVETPGVESEIAGETIQAVGKKGWRTYQPSFLRRKRKLGFRKCAAALSPTLLLRTTSLPTPHPGAHHTTPRRPVCVAGGTRTRRVRTSWRDAGKRGAGSSR
jgi:hypothetical protein